MCQRLQKSLIDSAKATMPPLDKFDDMKGHWANYDVEYMADRGLVSGVADNAFDPEANITRAEYVTILDRAMGYDLITGDSFADVDASEWYATYVATAKANGLLSGLPTDDGFKPEQPITREEMALFTYNAIKATGKNAEWVVDMPDDFANFADADSVSNWAKDALKYAPGDPDFPAAAAIKNGTVFPGMTVFSLNSARIVDRHAPGVIRSHFCIKFSHCLYHHK